MKYGLRVAFLGISIISAPLAFSAENDRSCVNRRETGITVNGNYFITSDSATVCVGQGILHIVQLPNENEISISEGSIISINDRSGSKLSLDLVKPFVKSTGFFGLGKKQSIKNIDVDIAEMSIVISAEGSFSGYSVDSRGLNFTFLRSKDDALDVGGTQIIKGSNRKIIAKFFRQEIALTLGRVFHSANPVHQIHRAPEREVLRDLTLQPTTATSIYYFHYTTLAEVTSDAGEKFALIYRNEISDSGEVAKSIHLVPWDQLYDIYYIYNHGRDNHGRPNRIHFLVDSLFLE